MNTKELNTGEGKNRYKYQPFNVLVENLEIDITQTWKEFNLSTDFATFVYEISSHCQSLPQLLYHKEKIIQILENHLKVKNSQALEPLLEDLGIEFYPYFEQIIATIIPLTKLRDVKTLKHAFNCIAYLFKYLFNQIIVDLRPTYRLIAPLFGEKSDKSYIRRFAAESFAYLLRHVKGEKLTNIIDYIFELFNESPSDTYLEGLCMIFYETAQDSDNKLHDSAIDLMQELLNKLYKDSSININNIESIYSYHVITSTTIALIHHSKSEHFSPLWDFYLKELKNNYDFLCKEYENSKNDLPKGIFIKVGITLSLARICLTVRKGNRVKEGLIKFQSQNIIDGLLSLLNQDCDWELKVNNLSQSHLDSKGNENYSHIALVSAVLTIIPHTTFSFSTTFDALLIFIETLVQFLRSVDSKSVKLHQERSLTVGSPYVLIINLIGQAIGTLTKICRINSEPENIEKLVKIWNLVIDEILIAYNDNLVILKGVSEYLDSLRSSKKHDNLFGTNNLEKIYPQLKCNLSSYLNQRRFYSLKILSIFDQFCLNGSEPSNNNIQEYCEIFSICLKFEEIETTVTTYRNKAMLLRKLDTLISTQKVPKFYYEVIPLLCFGIFTINFSAIWKDAIDSLVNFAKINPKEFWNFIYNELSKSQDSKFEQTGFSKKTLESFFKEDQIYLKSTHSSSGISFECPNLFKFNKLAEDSYHFITDKFANSCIRHYISCCVPENDKFDFWNYYSLLIKALIEVPHIAEEHSRQLIPLFLHFTNKKNDSISDGILRNVYLRFLAKGDIKIQALALECLFTWKYKGVVPYEDNLRNFVDESKFRDELSTFSLNMENGSIEIGHRTEVMPIIIRLLYGRMIARKGKSSSKTGMGSRRIAVLSSLVNCLESELGFLIDLLLEPFSIIRQQNDFSDSELKFIPNLDINKYVSFRKQLGYLNFIGDFLKQLGSYLVHFIPDLLKVVLYIVHSAQKNLIAEDLSQKFKNIRHLGLKRIVEFFKINSLFNYKPYIRSMFDSFISMRIPKLDIENTQAPSALMELFLIWTSNKDYLPYLVEYNKDLLPKIFACISSKKVQQSVITKVLDIIDNILKICGNEINEMEIDTEYVKPEEINLIDKVLKPYVPQLLDNLEYVLTQSSKNISFGKDTFSRREISILSHIASYIDNSEQAKKIVDLLLPYLRKSSRIIQEKTKADILRIVVKFLSVIQGLSPESELFQRYFNFISYEFSTLRSRDCRILLVHVLEEFSKLDNSLQEITKTIDELNAFSTKILDEPDFERRLNAFSHVNENAYKTYTPLQWLPLLHNCLFFIQDPDELSIRQNSSFCIIRFIDRVAEIKNKIDNDELKGSEYSNVNEKLQNLLIQIVYPAIKRGMKSNLELVRIEYLNVLSHAVKKCSTIPQFSDMACLLFDEEEANFFNNIHHIQMHRRTRALKRFSNECANGKLKNNNLMQIFAPLIGHFIFETNRMEDHVLINESISTIGIIARQLNWIQYYDLLKQYMNIISKKKDLEKMLVKTIIAILDSFHFEISETVLQQTSISLNQKIHNTIANRVIPDLKEYLSQYDDGNIEIRVPIAFSITKLLKALPQESLRSHLPGLLTTVCQILRSRNQDTRDSTRDTLIRISNFLGPLYFSFVVKELQGALTKGYQLHILGYTLNSLLTKFVPNLNVGSIDYCIQNITDIMINDVFGEVGKEKDVEEITNKMKEMKSSKSIGSFELLAKIIEFKNLGILLLPLKDIMRETQNTKTLSKVEEILQKIAIGLNANPKFDAKEMSIFCQGLISQNLDISKSTLKTKINKSNLEMNYIVQLKRDVANPIDYFDTNSYRFVQFGFTIFLAALKHEKFDLKTEENLEMLTPFVNIVGNSMYSQHQVVNILAIKVMSILCKLKLKSLDNALPVIVKQTFALIKTSGSTNSELAQNCFKLLIIVIRDCKQVDLKDAQLAFLIDLIRPDFENPDRQSTTFSLIRAIVSRKFVIPEIYDLMQSVLEIMITNQSSQTRDLSKQLLFQFLMDYPQGRGRLKNLINFLIRNLNYVFESGRQSVMEMMNLMITKFSDDILMEYAEIFFISLAMALINDDSNKCREMAGALIKILLRRMDEQHLRNVYLLIDKWFNQNDKKSLQRISVQIYGLIIESFGDKFKSHISKLLDILKNALISSKQILEQLESLNSNIEDNNENNEYLVDSVDWELGYYALNTFTKLLKSFPSILHSEKSKEIWLLVEQHILHPHTWIRLASSRLYGMYFANINPETMIPTGSNIKIDYLTKDVLKKIASSLCTQLKSEMLELELATQIRKSIYQWFAAMSTFVPSKELEPYLIFLISPIYRFINDETIKGQNIDNIKQLGKEVLDLIQKRVGTTQYHVAYNKVRQQVSDVRRERKKKRVMRGS
ncbi:840_t:CDS:10 [Diversispora eburnea]|uniref:840_t:CDS:1 n=1 Tax=Diversispora eburnea TaxID=1213867 RepID=A0A9N8ZKU2_9GLOM|nr:840_t:CDS:10 [Diversispora eburnea]